MNIFTFARQLKWQFLILAKNHIVAMSFMVTLLYIGLLFGLGKTAYLDQVLMAIILNDPTVIGYFFIGLSLFTERRQNVLEALAVSPVKLETVLVAKTVAITTIGVLCSLALAIPLKGLSFDLVDFTIGSIGLCALSALLALYVQTFTDEFLKFAMVSIPVFLVFTSVPLLQYLGAIDLGGLKYLLPVQGAVSLIDHALSGTAINPWYAYGSITVLVPLCYLMARSRFAQLTNP
ncbi:hypothetical protein J4E06_06820 [Muricauda sp. NFXS6]|uniref:fluoroquinolone export ABC transporter permease subunit n=1 Tax=Allomuricauda sp. NFXS6 TaxID=2819094 RepID=UPI0032E03A26